MGKDEKVIIGLVIFSLLCSITSLSVRSINQADEIADLKEHLKSHIDTCINSRAQTVGLWKQQWNINEVLIDHVERGMDVKVVGILPPYENDQTDGKRNRVLGNSGPAGPNKESNRTVGGEAAHNQDRR